MRIGISTLHAGRDAATPALISRDDLVHGAFSTLHAGRDSATMLVIVPPVVFVFLSVPSMRVETLQQFVVWVMLRPLALSVPSMRVETLQPVAVEPTCFISCSFSTLHAGRAAATHLLHLWRLFCERLSVPSMRVETLQRGPTLHLSALEYTFSTLH